MYLPAYYICRIEGENGGSDTSSKQHLPAQRPATREPSGFIVQVSSAYTVQIVFSVLSQLWLVAGIGLVLSMVSAAPSPYLPEHVVHAPSMLLRSLA